MGRPRKNPLPTDIEAPSEQAISEVVDANHSEQNVEIEIKSPEQQAAEESVKRNRQYYGNYPRIIGEICEFCGVNYKKCPHYQKIYQQNGQIHCLCGQSVEGTSIKQLNLLYLPHRNIWICDCTKCENAYRKLAGGMEMKVVYHFNKGYKIYGGKTRVLPEPQS